MRRLFKWSAFLFGLVGGWFLFKWLWESWQPQQIVSAPMPTVEPERIEPLETSTTSPAPPTSAPVEQTPPAPEPAPSPQTPSEEAPLAYCVRCRKKQPVNNPVYETTPKGRRRLRGTCAVCGAKVSQFVKST
ncbi:MAG: hypothetical protein D6802_10695 [Ardenticatenia bacterium]|nr:MAG: hypothetical protein D6802_10695 [Ardenticatenia bacterium]